MIWRGRKCDTSSEMKWVCAKCVCVYWRYYFLRNSFSCSVKYMWRSAVMPLFKHTVCFECAVSDGFLQNWWIKITPTSNLFRCHLKRDEYNLNSQNQHLTWKVESIQDNRPCVKPSAWKSGLKASKKEHCCKDEMFFTFNWHERTNEPTANKVLTKQIVAF